MRLYVITSEDGGLEETCQHVAACLQGGADVIQLRKKTMPKGAQYRLALKLRQLTTASNALLVINDNADLAVAADADGVHVGQDDLPVSVIRSLPGFEGRLIGCSTNSLGQAQKAVSDGADYIGVGPMDDAPSEGGRPAVRPELIREIASVITLPFVAIGRIDAANVSIVLNAGARAVAVMRAVAEARDPTATARAIRRQLDEHLAHENDHLIE